MLLRLLAPLTVAAFTLMSSSLVGAADGSYRAPVKLVDVRGAAALLARGAAVIDARDAAAYAQGHLPGAQMYAWQAFTGEGSARGRLKPDLKAIAQALAALGVDAGRTALVYGASAQGFGEEGHAAWLMALLGHPDVALLDGGFNAWRAAGRPVVTSWTRARVGTFEARPRGGSAPSATSWRARGRCSTCARCRSSAGRRPTGSSAAVTSPTRATSTGDVCSTRAAA